MKIFVSSCLLGDQVRYDGSHKYNQALIDALEGHEIVKGCTELLAGFPIPHPPIELKNDHAYFNNGQDVTGQLFAGAEKALKIFLDNHCDFAILKAKSPSCGRDFIYDGNFNGQMTSGDGAFTQLLKKHGIKIFNENEIPLIKEYLKRHQ